MLYTLWYHVTLWYLEAPRGTNVETGTGNFLLLSSDRNH